jgi:PhnB protein
MPVQPYLCFNGRCDEALAFYREALGAEVQMVMRFRESPEPCPEGQLPPGWNDKVMHSAFRIGDAVVMATDGMESTPPKFDGISLSIVVKTAAEADRYFNGLAPGGTVTMPIGRTFWSPRFGMVKDRFGVSWMVNAEGE